MKRGPGPRFTGIDFAQGWGYTPAMIPLLVLALAAALPARAQETITVNSFAAPLTRWGAHVPGMGYLPVAGAPGARSLGVGSFYPDLPPPPEDYRYAPLTALREPGATGLPAELARLAERGPVGVLIDAKGEVAGAVGMPESGPFGGYLGLSLSAETKAAVTVALAPPPPPAPPKPPAPALAPAAPPAAAVPQFVHPPGSEDLSPPEESDEPAEEPAAPAPQPAPAAAKAAAPAAPAVSDAAIASARMTRWGAHVPGAGYFMVVGGQAAKVPLFTEIPAPGPGFEHIELDALKFTPDNPMPRRLKELAGQGPVALVRNLRSGQILGAAGWNTSHWLDDAVKRAVAQAAPPLPPQPPPPEPPTLTGEPLGAQPPGELSEGVAIQPADEPLPEQPATEPAGE